MVSPGWTSASSSDPTFHRQELTSLGGTSGQNIPTGGRWKSAAAPENGAGDTSNATCFAAIEAVPAARAMDPLRSGVAVHSAMTAAKCSLNLSPTKYRGGATSNLDAVTLQTELAALDLDPRELHTSV